MKDKVHWRLNKCLNVRYFMWCCLLWFSFEGSLESKNSYEGSFLCMHHGLGKILTMDNLIKTGMVIGYRCILCKRSGENADHLLLHCAVAICSFCSEVSDAEEDEKIVLLLTKKLQDFRNKAWNVAPSGFNMACKEGRDRRMFVEPELSIERFKTQFLGSHFYLLFLNENLQHIRFYELIVFVI